MEYVIFQQAQKACLQGAAFASPYSLTAIRRLQQSETRRQTKQSPPAQEIE